MNDKLLKKLILEAIQEVLEEQDSSCALCNLKKGCKGKDTQRFQQAFMAHLEKVGNSRGTTPYNSKLEDINELYKETKYETFGPATEKMIKLYQKYNSKEPVTGVPTKDMYKFLGFGSVCR